jgi:hypothetical protein
MFSWRLSESITVTEFTVMSPAGLKAAEVTPCCQLVKRPRTCKLSVSPCTAPPGEMASSAGNPSSMSMACCKVTTSPSVVVVSAAKPTGEWKVR